VLPSLPLAVVLWLLIFFFNVQDVFWPFLVNVSPDRYNLNVELLQMVGRFLGTSDALAAAILFFVVPISVLFFLALGYFQNAYLDRLVLYSETPGSGETLYRPEGK
jgi:ABC-type glycerol-3-phosphate transport system permease component